MKPFVSDAPRRAQEPLIWGS